MIEFEYIKCMAGILLDEKCGEVVMSLRFDALQHTHAVAQNFFKKGFLPDLVEAFFVKKIEMIPYITTKKDADKYRKPSMPHYNGDRFVPSDNPYYVEQEELIYWSETSLRGPLLDAGYRRYLALFEKYLPEQAEQLIA